jgi:hypothetical protein
VPVSHDGAGDDLRVAPGIDADVGAAQGAADLRRALTCLVLRTGALAVAHAAQHAGREAALALRVGAALAGGFFGTLDAHIATGTQRQLVLRGELAAAHAQVAPGRDDHVLAAQAAAHHGGLARTFLPCGAFAGQEAAALLVRSRVQALGGVAGFDVDVVTCKNGQGPFGGDDPLADVHVIARIQDRRTVRDDGAADLRTLTAAAVVLRIPGRVLAAGGLDGVQGDVVAGLDRSHPTRAGIRQDRTDQVDVMAGRSHQCAAGRRRGAGVEAITRALDSDSTTVYEACRTCFRRVSSLFRPIQCRALLKIKCYPAIQSLPTRSVFRPFESSRCFD